MYLSRDAISTAKPLTLPDEDNSELTDYDKKVWQKALEWYSTYVAKELDIERKVAINKLKPEVFSRVYNALKKAKEFV